ncbi:FOG: Transposon-encoded proteins with TYA, reverse transcriptase, integrase domains in various combinations [Phaffia rhodozyma]|uniref:FOG: Transposon-encoded proteins with TYA, reverse transcriptase, integrase domains in various combinations n=1 Tax=Phaffia rhodozyma TaxID=264483 RepID=A0A0F7SJ83_PHARH|nr:FOG: Transposon-encoded proteins with TYA, reverse transcriptase, integrase domains in various combinations [Phaffia rhodozyma]
MSWPNPQWTSFTSVPPPSGSSAVGTRKRVGVACTLCRSRKVKCSGKTPCTRCASLGTTCTFEEVPEDLKQAAFARKERRKAVIQAEKAAAALVRTQGTARQSVNGSDNKTLAQPKNRSSSPVAGSSPPQRFYNLRTRRNALISSACLGLSPSPSSSAPLSSSSAALNLSDPPRTDVVCPPARPLSTPLSYLPVIANQNASPSIVPTEPLKVSDQTLLRPILSSNQPYLSSYHPQLNHGYGYLTPPIMPLGQPSNEAYFERDPSSSSTVPSLSPEPDVRTNPTKFALMKNEAYAGTPLTPLDQRPEEINSMSGRKRALESNGWAADQPLLKMRRQAVCLGPATEVDQIKNDPEHFGTGSIVLEQSEEWLRGDIPKYSVSTEYEESCQTSNSPWVPPYVSSISGA